MINDPFDRARLFDLLRPPDGFMLDEAIGTTYSLDLPALLVTPLAFTLFDAESSDGAIRMQSFEVLESLRRYARKVAVFAHCGRTLSPSLRLPQFIHLENVVVQCLPRTGSFHPKVWVLRFVSEGGDVRYRVLCLTRNLTFDRSWDTALSLEGTLGPRNAARNHPLGDFVAALPTFAVADVPDAIRDRVGRFAEELRRVAFELPDDVDEIRFCPIGIDRYAKPPFGNGEERMLVISPFLSKRFLHDLLKDRPNSILISTPFAIGEAAPLPQSVGAVYSLNPAALPEPQSSEDGDVGETCATGLHAKCYVADDGRTASIYTGSANATWSAFHGNVEFLVELRGRSRRLGINALLEPENGTTRLIDVIVPVSQPGEADAIDEKAAAIQKALELARDALSRAALRLEVEPEEHGGYTLRVNADADIAIPAGVVARSWPVTLPETFARSLDPAARPLTTFSSLTPLALSRFLTIELSAGDGLSSQCIRFVLLLPMTGAPADREDQVLQSMLSDRGRFVEYLLLLIADDRTPSADDGSGITLKSRGNTAARTPEGPALLETLLRTLDRAPERLDHVHRLVSDLKSSERGRDLLPPDFDAIWEPIWAAREKGRSCLVS